MDWGWNLRDLQDLLHLCKVPEIPGVTTPMTYFGMWKVGEQQAVAVLSQHMLVHWRTCS